jgi:hypothetical protein
LFACSPANDQKKRGSFGLPLEEERRWRERNLFALYSTINELLIEEEAISLKSYNKNERNTSIF